MALHRFSNSDSDLRIDAVSEQFSWKTVHRFSISGSDLRIDAAKRSKQEQSLHPKGWSIVPRPRNAGWAGTSDGVAARGFVNGYSKRKTRVFSIIFRCRFFERTSHIVDIRCAQRGVPPLAARPSPEKFFIVSMIIAMRKRITPSGTMLCACILKAATCWRCRLTNTSNGHEV